MNTLQSPSDVAPGLRGDLVLTENSAGRGEATCRIEDPLTGKSLEVRSFELSIARMLDGRRTGEEIIDAAARIGLPLSFESLNAFLHRAHEANFLATPAPESSIQLNAWKPRQEWGPEVRRLFQDALRQARADQLGQARSTLEQLIAIAPGTREAEQLLGWLAAHQDQRPPAFADVFSEVERSWFAKGEAESAAVAAAPAGLFEAAEELAPEARSKKPLFIGAGAVATLGLVLLVPLPHEAQSSCSVEARKVVSVTYPRPGPLGKLAVTEGQWVTKGTPLFAWDTHDAEAKLAAFDARQAELKAQMKAAKLKPGNAEARVKALEAELKKAQGEFDKLKAKAKGKKTPALVKAEKKLAPIAAALKGAQAAVELEAAAAQRAELEKSLAGEKQVLAPADGFVAGLNSKTGEVVGAGSLFARLEDTRTLTVKVALPPGEALTPGAAVSVELAGAKAEVKVEKVDGQTAIAPLENPKNEIKASATGTARFPGSSKSLLGRL